MPNHSPTDSNIAFLVSRFQRFAQNHSGSTLFVGGTPVIAAPARRVDFLHEEHIIDVPHDYRDHNPKPIVYMTIPNPGNSGFLMSNVGNMLEEMGLAEMDEKCRHVPRKGVSYSNGHNSIRVTVDPDLAFGTPSNG